MAQSADTPGLTAWERRRAENAKVNNAILNSISKTSAKVFAATTKNATTTQTKKKPARRVKAEPIAREAPMPTRRSARVAGIEADPETRKRKLDDVDGVLEYGLGESAPIKEKRLRVSGDLALGDMQVDGRWHATLQGLSELSSAGASTRPSVQPGVRTFTDEDIQETTDAELKALRKEMNSLELFDKFEVKGSFRSCSTTSVRAALTKQTSN